MIPMRALRYVAIVPAAGESRRMGRPKLLLPWRSSTVLQSVLEAWSQSEVDCTILVVRSADPELAEIGRRCGVDVVVAESSPPEMKDSVRLALHHVRQRYRPDRAAWWLLGPADNPCLNVDVINRVCRMCATSDAEIVAACYAGTRAHPIALAWPLAEEVQTLGNGEGVNTLLSRHRVQYIDVDDPAILHDIDTPDDYERLK
jgi:molybdenum cofactor cytidylyltransferase